MQLERMENRRELYYIDGSTVRRRAVEPDELPRRRQPQKKKRTVRGNITYPQAAVRAEKSLYFDRGYATVLVIASLIMIFSFAMMTYFQGRVDDQQRNIRIMQNELQELEADNVAFEDSLDSKYSLDHIYKVATSELGMVYSKKGQIVYYDKANEDYVKQVKDVPDAN